MGTALFRVYGGLRAYCYALAVLACTRMIPAGRSQRADAGLLLGPGQRFAPHSRPDMPPPIPEIKGSSPPPIPMRSPKRPPIGAVATAMVSGQGRVPIVGQVQPGEEQEDDVQEEARPNNPYDLVAIPGSTVIASYPFHGDDKLQQLSFTVGDLLKVKQKGEMWSWGVLERDGNEGWFPHNYVGTTFKPLPGIHEMAAKLRERREKLETARDEHDAAASARNSTPSHPSATDVQPEHSETVEESHSLREVHPRTESPPRSGTGRAPTDASTCSEDVDAANDAEMKTFDVQRTSGTEALVHATTSSTNNSVKSVASAAPALPPFFKDVGTSNVAATAASLTTGEVNEAKTTEVVDSTQIHGVGYSGESVATKTGCLCIVM